MSKYILDIYRPIIPKATSIIEVTKKITLINNHKPNPLEETKSKMSLEFYVK